MAKRRVVITGMGVISALGEDRQAFWSALEQGRSGIAPIEAVDRGRLSYSQGAEVRGFDPARHFESRAQRKLDRFAQFALIATREALADCALAWDEPLRERTAVITGTGIGGACTQDAGFEKLYARGGSRMPPQLIPNIMANAGASQISLEHGFRGPAFTLSTACSSSNHALGLAFWMVRDGVAEVALSGGSEAIFNLGSLMAWDSIRVVSEDTCRPFSRSKPGMILGEGGAMLVLETLEAARARGARIYAEIAGFGMSADAHHLTMPSLEGPARAMQLALEDAGLDAREIDYINAHGTGTPANDPNEIAAIHAVFGAHAANLAVSSTKSMHGHALGAAGALEAVATALAIHRGILPPTANLDEIDPECDLDVVPNESRPAAIRAALSNSFGFGGLNAVLALRRLGAGQNAGGCGS